ncbi:MAG TPA: potassium channel family protein [Gemmataceae bacterium]|nr:potassium channel family protein [Gemmataceae bacterium]
MGWLGAIVALAIIGLVLLDAFEVMILPRRVRHGWRLARFFYRTTWKVWRALANRFTPGRWRNGFLSVFGPLSLFALIGVWAVGLVFGFALLHWSLGTAITFQRESDQNLLGFLYFSGTTFFTLGYGDITPTGPWGRLLSIAEAGLGFGFLAVVISYLPVLYQAFSKREIAISLLDARAGSPPTAGELLRRLAVARAAHAVGPLLQDWERWAAEVLESHLSFPVLAYYRSQHDNQSWVAALTTILDTSAILIAGTEECENYQARLAFAMARHAAVDLALVFHAPPQPPKKDRLSESDFQRLRESLRSAGLKLREGASVEKSVAEMRGLYEPVVNALANYFQFAVPAFLPEKPPVDNWQTSPWMPRAPELSGLSEGRQVEDHFD